MINIICPSRYKITRPVIKKYAEEALSGYEWPSEMTVNVIFVGKIKMRSIAKTYKQENVALPVLTFHYGKNLDTNTEEVGEIFICYPQAVLLAAEREKTVNQIMEFLISHAVDNLLKK